jgi:hypothetical protein
MQFITDNSQARLEIAKFILAHQADAPAEVLEELNKLASSPVISEAVVMSGELLYARHAELPVEGKLLAAALSAYRIEWGWWRDPDGSSTRARAIAHAMMREAGEPAPLGVEYGDAQGDPAPLEQFKAREA